MQGGRVTDSNGSTSCIFPMSIFTQLLHHDMAFSHVYIMFMYQGNFWYRIIKKQEDTTQTGSGFVERNIIVHTGLLDLDPFKTFFVFLDCVCGIIQRKLT